MAEVDIEKLSDEELKNLANAPQPEEEAVEEEEKVEEPAPTVFRREIDLGDGSGKQVFEAPTMDALVDALTQAQTHATRKIRELSREDKVEKAGAKEAEERELTADEEWLLSQELLNHPAKTQKKIIEGMFGASIDDVREALEYAREARKERQADEASADFMKKHPEFYACDANGRRMIAYVRTYQLIPSVDTFEKAFKDLQESGLLESKPEEEVPSAESDTAEQQESSRIAKTESKPVATPRRAGSGLTSRGRAATVVKPTQPTEEELYAMPFEKLEELARKAARGENSE